MKHYIKDTRGSTPLLAAFLAAVLCILAIIIYSGAMIYTNYQIAQTELEQAAGVSVDANLININVRDLVLDIPESEVLSALENNLSSAGYHYTYTDDAWQRIEEGTVLYSFKEMDTIIDGDRMTISAVFTMPLLWNTGLHSVEIPIQVVSKVLYIE